MATAMATVEADREIDFPLHQAQKDFLESTQTIRGFVGGRGAGKSHIGAYDLLRRAKADRLYMVVAPSYKNLEDSTFRTYREIASSLGLLVEYNKVRFRTVTRTFDGGKCEVLFRSADDPDSLRGPNLSGVWIDEAGQVAHEAFQVVLACLREKGEQGWISATFTPKGRSHWTYEVFGTGSDSVELFHARSRDNPFLPPTSYSINRPRYGDLQADQELEGLFVDVAGAEWPADYFTDDIWLASWPSRFNQSAIAVDPSLGKSDKYGDYSAVVFAGVVDGIIYVDAVLFRARADMVVARTIEMYAEHEPDVIAVETNQFQALLIPEFQRQARERGIGPLPLEPIINHISKNVRIRNVGFYLGPHEIRFRKTPGCELLVEQLREFPEGRYDDGPDALEMALRTIKLIQLGRRADDQETVVVT